MIPQEELENIAGERDVWNTLLSLQPLQPDPDKLNKWMAGWMPVSRNTFPWLSEKNLELCFFRQ